MKKIIKTILIILSFYFLEFMLGGVIGTFSKILIPIYGLSLLKRQDDLALKTIFWFSIVVMPLVFIVSLAFK